MGFLPLEHTWWSCTPTAPREFLQPLAFCFVEALTQAVKDNAVVDFSVGITLWIVESRESVDNFILEAEAQHLPAREVGPVFGDDGMRKSKATYNILPEVLDYLLP